MGTSSMYGGPRTGLVPSWVDDPAPGVKPSPNPATSPLVPGQGGEVPAVPAGSNLPAAQPDPAGTGAFKGARTGFTRFARTGSRSALESALSHYVHSGTGGARRAARRMGSSRSAGSRLLGVIHDVGRLGAAETLRNLNLPNLAGRPAADVFLALIEFVCPPGGSIDEAIARQAMLEAICDIAETGLGDFDALTPAQLEEFFLDFITLPRISHTPPDLVVTSQSSQNTLALSIPYPYPAASAPMTSDRGMRHGTRRQTDTPQPHDHRQLP